MNATEFRNAVKSGLAGGYLFYGSEEYMKRHCLSLAKKSVLGEDGSDFGYVKLSGEGKSLSELASHLSDLFATPSFTPCKLTELHECMLLKPSEADLSRFVSAMESIKNDKSNVFVLYTNEQELDAGSAKSPSKVFRALSACMTPVEFAKESGAKLTAWVNKHFASQGIAARADLCAELIDYSGHDMTTLADEIDKLCFYLLAHGRRELAREDIPLVACSYTEINAFDFSNALLARDRERVFAILSDMKGKKEEPVVILGGISKMFSEMCSVKALSDRGMQKAQIAKAVGMHEYAVSLRLKAVASRTYEELSKAVAACLETDIKLKSSSEDKYLLLELLVVRLLSGR
ncbi:MAG: DNA polymerase III subunit delta [Ruminococcaceae bacterium]|nr:DNA polymerase III subunit delta [Oscillospiraceae bacterium]